MKILYSIGNRRNSLFVRSFVIFFTLKSVFLFKMEAADDFASISSPKVCKFTLRYSILFCFKLPLRSGVFWGLTDKKLLTLIYTRTKFASV